jgi:deoxyribodipyrimidine photo-lyase
VLAGVRERHAIDNQQKLVYELGWCEYFHHVWRHEGESFFEDLHAGRLPRAAYADALPADIRQARTGVPAIDAAVRELYTTGWLHNHARMWLASYVVHLRKVRWRAGAEWLYGHLLDGGLASKHLSWQWVAGTGSHKPCLFNAVSVERYAPSEWHSGGTPVDASYEALDAIAHRPHAVPGAAGAQVQGRVAGLVHRWSLGEPQVGVPADALGIDSVDPAFHARWPWSAHRSFSSFWHKVSARGE